MILNNRGNSEIRLPFLIIVASGMGMFLKGRVPGGVLLAILVVCVAVMVVLMYFVPRKSEKKPSVQKRDCEAEKKQFLTFCKERGLSIERYHKDYLKWNLEDVEGIEVQNEPVYQELVVLDWNSGTPPKCIICIGCYELIYGNVRYAKRIIDYFEKDGIQFAVPDEFQKLYEWEESDVSLDEDLGVICVMALFLLIIFVCMLVHVVDCIAVIGIWVYLFIMAILGFMCFGLIGGICDSIKMYTSAREEHAELDKWLSTAYAAHDALRE